MARKSQRFVIGQERYDFTQLGASEGVELFHDLRKAAMPALRALLSDEELLAKLSTPGVSTSGLDAALAGRLAGVVLSLFEAMPRELERALRNAFARNCKVGVKAEGQHGGQIAFIELGDASIEDGVFDQHFAGEYGRYQQWLLQGLKFNFAGFLGGSGSASVPDTAKASP